MIRRLAAGLAGLVLAAAPAALAFDARQTFAKGSFVISPEVAYGNQFNLEGKHEFSDVQFVNARRALRLAALQRRAGPARCTARSSWAWSPCTSSTSSRRTHSSPAWASTGRYHFLSLGRFVPYAEMAPSLPGGTDLKVFEIDSTFTFVVWAGVGASYFVTDRTALYAGYRYEHISNGDTRHPNRGLETQQRRIRRCHFFSRVRSST